MRKKCKHTTVVFTEEQNHRTHLHATDFDTTLTNLLANLLDRLPDALRHAHYPKSQAANSETSVENEKIVLKLCSHLTRNNPATYARFQPAILWQYPSIVSANA